jgi:hypothetical protein
METKLIAPQRKLLRGRLRPEQSRTIAAAAARTRARKILYAIEVQYDWDPDRNWFRQEQLADMFGAARLMMAARLEQHKSVLSARIVEQSISERVVLSFQKP